MAFNYAVSYSTTANGPWTAFNTVSTSTDTVTGLAPGTNYYFQIITQDTVSGLTGTPVVTGPFLTQGTGTSPSGTTIPPATALIDTNLNSWTLNTTTGVISINGIADGTTNGAVLLLWYNNLIYQHVVNATFPSPGNWWSSPAQPANWTGGGTWTDVGNTDPRPALGITVSTIPTEINNTSFVVSGTVTGFTTTPVLNYQDTINGVVGAFQALPGGATLPTSGNSTFSFTHPVIATVNANNHIVVRDTGLLASTTSNTFSVITPPTIQTVSLSNNSFAANSAIGTAIGTLTATMNNGTFSGTFSLPSGVANDSSFQISNGNILAVGTAGLAVGNYSINVTATQAGVSNSPYTQTGVALTATSGPAVGPAATSNFITVDFSSKPSNNQVVAKYVWGMGTSTLSDNFFAQCANGGIQTALKALNYPLYRFNASSFNPWCEAAFGSGTTASAATLHGVIGNLIDNWSKFMPADARIILGMGLNPTQWTVANYKTMCTNFVNYIRTTNSAATGVPMPVYGFETGNENNGASWYNDYFNAAAQAVHGVNASFGTSYKMAGPVFSYSDNLGGFGQGVGSNCDVLDYHAYKYGGQGEFDSQGGISAMLTNRMFAGLAGDLSTFVNGGGNSNAEIFIGEYNQNNTYGTLNGGNSPGICNTYMQNAVGAVFNANCVLSGINATPKFTMGGIWSAQGDSDYGMIGGADNVNGGGNTPCPGAYFLSKAAATLFGSRRNITAGGLAPNTITHLAVTGSITGTSFAVMLINASQGSPVNSVQVALSHWPVNSTGNGQINQWVVSPASTSGALTQLSVSAGLTSAITLPAQSITILYV